MKKEVYKSKYLTIIYDSEKQLIAEVFNKATEDMTKEDYKAEMLELLEIIKKYRPQNALVNLIDLMFPIEPEIQQWQKENVFDKGNELGLNKAAILLSRDLFTQVSIEQSLEEADDGELENKYFDNEEEAMQWLAG